MGCSSESVAYSRIVASYRRRMGVVAVREMWHATASASLRTSG